MRAGPLSEPGVISLLNAHFVPVYVSNEDYGKSGSASAEEKKAHERIYREALSKKLSAGTVHVYILSPGGNVIDSRHVAKAAERGEVERLLLWVVEKLKTPAGKPLAKPSPQSLPLRAGAEDLVLHLVARGKGCSWDGIPSESWIVLSKPQWLKLLPPREAAVGDSWDLDGEAAASILAHFYPQTENNNASPRRIESSSLRAELVTLAAGRGRARLEGKLKMKHDFYPGRDDGRFVEASVSGYMDFERPDAGEGRIHAFRLVTEKAVYGPGTIEVAVRSVSTGAQQGQ